VTALATKTPEEVKDFSLDWSKDLGADTITTSAWTISPGDPTVTQSSIAAGNMQTVAWIAGGTIGLTYDVTNTINTAGGRELTKTFRLYVTGRNYL
jgi:hypothetical protein